MHFNAALKMHLPAGMVIQAGRHLPFMHQNFALAHFDVKLV